RSLPTGARGGEGGIEAMGCIQNWPVSGTAAEVPVERLLHVMFVWRRIVPQQGVEAHDDAGCAESALATITNRHPLLDRMGFVGAADTLDGDDMLPVDAGQGCQTSIYAGMVDLLGGWVILAHNDGASAAST